jgi:hypothetical protein
MANPAAPGASARPPARRPPPSRRARLILLTVSVALALLVAELALRAVRPQFTLLGADFYAADPELGFVLRPGHDGTLEGVGEFATRIRVDSRGLRGGEPSPATARQPHVLGVGDSFLFGWGVEEHETFLALASREVGAVASNGGIPNYSTCQATARARRLLPELRPDVVLVAVFAGNDELDELVPVADFRVEEGRLRSRLDRPRRGWRAAVRAVTDRSHLLRALRASSLGARLGKALGAPPPARARLLAHSLLTYAEPPPPGIGDADRRIAGCLRELHDAATAAGAEVVAALLPADLAVVPGALAATAGELGDADHRYDPDAPRRRLLSVLRDSGVPHVDLHPPLARAVAEGVPVFFPNDRHYTAVGHGAVAAALGQPLRHALESRAASAP